MPHKVKSDSRLMELFQKEERKAEALSAVDMFKATHNSKTKGFSQEVQLAIVSFLMCSSLDDVYVTNLVYVGTNRLYTMLLTLYNNDL